MNTHLFVIGLGPGDPELLTLKGLKRLQAASVVFVPRSCDGQDSLARQIAVPHLDLTRQRVVELPLVMVRDADQCIEAWEAAAEVMAREMPANGAAAYLLLGDPSLYGTFTYLAGRLLARRPDVTVEIVPGVHSYSVAAALAGWPLACGEERVAILPAAYEDDPGLIRQLLTEFDTLILLKANKALPRLTRMLRAMGLADRVLIAERLGFPDQRVFHGLAAVEGASLNYLSLAIIRRRD
ncbi:MAG: precorrin-2 C(20)-methyltransferase [Chloroflexi bacterium]|nr:precorrin-2 C(20)-methyltransferase [Chloroflexota bacterium]